MLYVLAAIILTPVTVVAFAKFMKRRLDRNHPDFDHEGEIESFLADDLELALAKEVRS